MLKKIALALLALGLAGCGPLAFPTASSSASTQDPKRLNDFSAMRCESTATPSTGC